MKSKPFLIAIAAFAVTATGVQAYQGTQILEKAGLNDEQIEAFETARELREAGDRKAARDALLEAGVDEEVMKSVHKAMHDVRDAIHNAVEAKDYEAFKTAAAGTSLVEAINTEEDFEKFIEAHSLKEEGRWNEAKEILDDLSSEQQEALQVARKANDKEAVRAILKEAGIERPHHKGMHW